jgi:hypothetical protein
MTPATVVHSGHGLLLEPKGPEQQRLQAALEHLGLEVTVSGSVEEAELVLEREPISIVIADYDLFVLRHEPRVTFNVPVMVLTESPALPPAHAAAINAGAELVLDVAAFAQPPVLKHYVNALTRGFARQREPVPKAPSVAEAFALAAPELQDESGRLDARRVADFLDVPLKSLVTGLADERTYKAVFKTPNGTTAQTILQPVFNIIATLQRGFGGDRSSVLRWLRTSRAELRDQAPLDVMLKPGQIRAVSALVSQAWLGIPD